MQAAITLLKGIFGTDRPRRTTLERPQADVEVSDGKSDKDRLRDLGL
jgi:hypothetical protein